MTLPTIGGGEDAWGTTLNAHINIEHNADGTHKATEVTAVVTGEGIFGTRTANDSLGNSLAVTSIYRVGSDGFVTFVTNQGGTAQVVKLLTDSSATPTTTLYHSHGDWGAGRMSGCVPIIKDDYFQITVASGSTVENIRWLPIGSGTAVKQ